MNRTNFSPLIDELVESLRCLPGVGQKSAQRMAFYLLEKNRDGGLTLSKALTEAIQHVGQCELCRTLSESPLCRICSLEKRDKTLLCIVENPSDMLAIEQTGGFRGLYFVLMGHLSPLDGIGPADLGIDLLKQRLTNGMITEVIVATNPTVEGEATAQYLADIIKSYSIKTTRIAHGIPMGGELEYVDIGTISHAIIDRKTI